MTNPYLSTQPLPQFDLWQRLKKRRTPISFDIELTARCNNHCRHCYINLPARDAQASEKEISAGFIDDIARQAVEMGALWCLITGGEPLLRADFADIYLALKKRGLLVSVFTNATLVTDRHIRLFRQYPPRDIEVTVYGATRDTYENVTRMPGAFDAFTKGINRLLEAGLNVCLKAMALRSNLHEMAAIGAFCRRHTRNCYRFDPMLHLRYDRDPARNAEILAERLRPDEIAALEKADPKRWAALEKECSNLKIAENRPADGSLFCCGAGNGSFTVGWQGELRLCASLCHADTVYDLAKGSLEDFWQRHIPKVRQMRSNDSGFLETCHRCPRFNLCAWCPAHADLETGRMDRPVKCFCEVAANRTTYFE